MASKRKQGDAFSHPPQTWPGSSADSFFSTSPSLNSGQAIMRSAEAWQNGDQATQPTLNNGIYYNNSSSALRLPDTNCQTNLARSAGNAAANQYVSDPDYHSRPPRAGEDMSNHDHFMNQTRPNGSRTSFYIPLSNLSLPSNTSQSYLPGQTVSPADVQQTTPTGSPAHLLSPATTNTSSPEPMPVSTQSHLRKPVVPQASGGAIPPTSLQQPESSPSLKEGSWQGTSSNRSSSYLSQTEMQQNRPSSYHSIRDGIGSGPSRDTAFVADEGLEQAPTRQGLTPGERAQLNEAEIPSLEEEAKRRETAASNDSVKQWLDEFDDSDEDGSWETRTSLAENSPPTPRASHAHVLQTRAEAKDTDPSSLDARFRRVNLRTDSEHDDDPASMNHIPENSTRAIEWYERQARANETASVATTYASSRRTSRADDIESIFSASGISQRTPSYAIANLSSFEEALEPATEPPRHKSILNKMQRRFSREVFRRRKESQETATGGAPSLGNSRNENQNSNPSTRKTSSPGHTPSSSRHDSSSRPSLIGSAVGSINQPQKKPFFARNRSRSDVGGGDGRSSALAQQWAACGGPPVPNVRPSVEDTARYQEQASLALDSDLERAARLVLPHWDPQESTTIGHEFDEEEDEVVTPTTATAGHVGIVDVPATATLDGFRNHTRKLGPHLAPILAERIAQEQMKRYRILVDLRIEHHQHVSDYTCKTGQRCAGLGTGPKYVRSSKGGADKDRKVVIFKISPHTPDHEVEHLGFGETPQLANFPEGIPLPPVKQLPAQFECPMCFKVKVLEKPSDWSKHCLEDLYPFTCSFADCTEPRSFGKKADWRRHEAEVHLKQETWTCNYTDCTHVCHRHDNFIQHLVRTHNMPDPKKQGAKRRTAEDEHETLGVAKNCHRDTTERPEEQKCPFCGNVNVCSTWTGLGSHLADHMMKIFLPLLTLIEKEDMSRYIQLGNGTGLVAAAFQEASVAQHYPGSVGMPPFADSISPQPPVQQMRMNGHSNGSIFGSNGQTMVHPAFHDAAHTFPGTKNLPKQPSPSIGSELSKQSFNSPQFGRDIDPRYSTYLDAHQHTGTGQRTPTPSTYPPPTYPPPSYDSTDYLAVISNQSFYPATNAYENDTIYTTSPTFEQGANGSHNDFIGVMPNGTQSDMTDPTQYFDPNFLNNGTTGQNNVIHNSMSMSMPNNHNNNSMNSNMESNFGIPTTNQNSGFMPSQLARAQNAQTNAQYMMQQNVNPQYFDQRSQMQQTMNYDANYSNGTQHFPPLDQTGFAPQFPANGLINQQQAMPGQQQYQQRPHMYGQVSACWK